MMVIC